jgi:hypothetical protein
VTDLTADLDATFTQYVDANGSELASPISFTGNISLDLDRIPVVNDPEDLALPRTLSLSGTFSNTLGDSLTASLNVNVNNTLTFEFVGNSAPQGSLYSVNHPGAATFVSWTYSDSDGVVGADTFSYEAPEYNISVYWNSVDEQATYSYSHIYDGINYSGSFTYDYIYSLNEALNFIYIPDVELALIEGEGYYRANLANADFSVSGSSDGVLIEPEFTTETADNWIDAEVGLTFTAQLNGLPEARFNFVVDRSGYAAASSMLSISYGNRKIVFAANLSDDQAASTASITNQDGVVLNITNLQSAPFEGVVSYNGIQYATITTTSSGYLRTTYTDGSFEIF